MPMMLVVQVQPMPLPGAGIWYRCQSRQHRASLHPGEKGTLLGGSVGAEQGREVAAICQNLSCGCGADTTLVLLLLPSPQPLAPRSVHTCVSQPASWK